MSSGYVSNKLRQRLRSESDRCCSYCRSSEILSGIPLVIEHIIPRSHDGKTVFANLCLSCYRCNEFKGDKFQALDPLTEETVPLFHPRQQHWHDHFTWSRDGMKIIGVTPTGRATVQALQLNNKHVLAARQIWIAIGLHPPLY